MDWIFLFGGLAVAGPVIAHLLARPRFRRLPFTMLRFLHTGQVESQSRRKLRDLLILLLRCAIIVLIAMLFARPFLHVSPDPEQAENTFYVGLDNSMSMAYSDGSGSYFDKMVGQALDYVRSADADPGAPVFNICALASGRWSCDLSKEQALAEVKAMKIEPDSANVGDFLSGLGRSNSVGGIPRGEGVPPLPSFSRGQAPPATSRDPEAVPSTALGTGPASVGMERGRDALATRGLEARDTARARHSNGKISVAVLSDFTPHILSQFISIEEPAAVDEIDYRLITSAGPVDNAAIVDARVAGLTDGKLTVDASVANYGRTVQDRQLKASAGPNASAPVEIRLSPNQRGSYQVQLNVSDAGRERLFLPVELSLSGSDGLKEDDTFYMGVSIPEQRNINILIAGDSPAQLFLLKTALDALSRMSPYNALKVGQVRIDDLAHSDLDWADVVVCSTIVGRLDALAADVQNFVRTGGRLICFVTERVATEAAKRLWQQDVLAAMPGKYVPGRMYPEPKPCEGRVVGVDDLAARSLVNYRIDKILLKAYLECTPHAESRCLWQLQNGAGFIYLKEYGNGTTIFVNTSIDDSLGTLTKSNASVAFCRYLLGESAQIAAYCFARNERVLLPVPEGAARVRSDAVRRFDKMPSRAHYEQQSWVQTCDGKKRQAAISGSQLLVPDPAGIGWVKTLDKPTMYAGVNLPPGETDMTGPDDAELAAVVSRVLPKHADTSSAEAGTLEIRLRKPLWRIIAWLLILLLLAEPAVANRLKR